MTLPNFILTQLKKQISKQKPPSLQILCVKCLRQTGRPLVIPLTKTSRRQWRSWDRRLHLPRDLTASSATCISLMSYLMTSEVNASPAAPSSWSNSPLSCWSETETATPCIALWRRFPLRLSFGFTTGWMLRILCLTLWNMTAPCAV